MPIVLMATAFAFCDMAACSSCLKPYLIGREHGRSIPFSEVARRIALILLVAPVCFLPLPNTPPIRDNQMSDQSLPYVIHSDEECERWELQARLANIEGHLRHLPIAGAHRVLDVGCGSGSMSRLIARSFPGVEVVGIDVREQYLDYARARARQEGLH